MGLGRDEHLVDDHGRLVDTEHARDREAPDVGVDDRHIAAPLGQRHSQVGGDRRLSDATLAGGDEQHPGAAASLAERNLSALGVPVGGVGSGGGGRVAVDHRADGLALPVGHDGELDGHRADAVEWGDGLADGALDLGLEGAAGHGEGDGDAYRAAVDGDLLDHAEVDDAAT